MFPHFKTLHDTLVRSNKEAKYIFKKQAYKPYTDSVPTNRVTHSILGLVNNYYLQETGQVAMEWVDDKVEKVVALVTKIIVPLSYLFFGSTFLLYLSPILRLGDFQMTFI